MVARCPLPTFLISENLHISAAAAGVGPRAPRRTSRWTALSQRDREMGLVGALARAGGLLLALTLGTDAVSTGRVPTGNRIPLLYGT